MVTALRSDFKDNLPERDLVSFPEDTVVTDDERLIRDTFIRSPEEGCSMLFRRYYVNLCNHAIRFVHSKEVAEDIVSELFATFWQNQIFHQVTTSYRAYLYKAVRHRAYNYLKWQHNRTDPLEAIPLPPTADTTSPDDALHYTELHLKIESIIRQLPPQCRRAYLLKRVEGLKYEEVAHELQISEKAVEALVSRALSKLRKGLKENWFLGILCIPVLGNYLV